MIGPEVFERIARLEQTSVFPNVVREYAQHLFLTELYQLSGAAKLLFKGGTALRIVYNSPRFSEDLDFSLFGVPTSEASKFVEDLFFDVLIKMQANGIRIEINSKSTNTGGGYIGLASLYAEGYSPITIEINISFRNGRSIQPEVDSISNNFVSTYILYHLPQSELVEEKVFGALVARKKPRDYYDLYFMMRRGMLSAEQKKRLGDIASKIINDAKGVDFQGELGTFLPVSQQPIIRSFPQTLEREMRSQLALH